MTRWVESGGVRLAVREEGVGPTVLLVHGYPDNSSVWDGVAARLKERFRVVRFDLRGCGESGEPDNRAGFRVERLVEDLVAVVEAVSPDAPVHLVAHDWGSILGWVAVGDPAARRRFASFTSVSGPNLAHIDRWAREPKRLPAVVRQAVRSWYMAGFQVPGVPELVWRVPRLRKKFDAEYRDARNGLELYRANMFGAERPEPHPVTLPVLQIAQTRDPFCLPVLLEAAEPWCENLWRRELAAGHWGVRTHPEAVARFVTEFVDHVDGGPATRGLRKARVGQPRLTNALVLVTGAGSGIGRASALEFAAAGADVLCVDVDAGTAKQTAELVAAFDRTGTPYRLDVSDGAATRELADRVLAEHGVPDVVMANAGIGVGGPFLRTSVEDWRRVLDVNLWGVVHTLRAFLPAMVDRGEGGHVVITASMAGFLATPNLPAYSTTKAGVLMLAQCLEGELRPAGIGVSAICPGVVHTNITNTARFAGATPEEERVRQRRTTAAYRKRGYGPEKVAKQVVRSVLANRVVVAVTPEARVAAATNRVSPALGRAFGRWIDARAEKLSRG